MKKRRNREAKRTFFKSSMSEGNATAPVILNAFPVNSKPLAPSCAKSHQNSTPVQLCATCLCLPKNKAKKHGHCQKNLAKAFEDYLAKEGCLEDPFSKQILRNYQPCVSTPKTPEQHKDCVNENTLSISNLAQYFILQLMRNIP